MVPKSGNRFSDKIMRRKSVNLVYFAWVRERIGKTDEELDTSGTAANRRRPAAQRPCP